MRVLIACERSAIVRDAFRALGHNAWSCDFLPTLGDPRWHLQTHALSAIRNHRWDLLIAHPPCQYLASSGARWWKNHEKEQAHAIRFVWFLLFAPIPRIALENPPGKIGTDIRKADQTIQPWQFGDSFQKTTCLWLKGLPLLIPTKIVDRGPFVIHGGKLFPRWYSNRERERDITFPGIARAMAMQWGNWRL